MDQLLQLWQGTGLYQMHPESVGDDLHWTWTAVFGDRQRL